MRIENNALQLFVEVYVNRDVFRIIEGLDTAITATKTTSLYRIYRPQVAADGFFGCYRTPSKDSVFTILGSYFFARRNRRTGGGLTGLIDRSTVL